MGYLDWLLGRTKEQLVNEIYNNRIGDWCDKGGEKLIPYIGWFWRETDIAGRHITIGDAGTLIGVMENNKWGYPERYLTPEEADTFVGFLERAWQVDGASVNDPQREAKVIAVLRELHDWMQTLTIDTTPTD